MPGGSKKGGGLETVMYKKKQSPVYKMKGSPYQHGTGGAQNLFKNIGSGMGLSGIISNLFGGGGDGGGGGNMLQGLLGGLLGKKDNTK